MKPYEKVKIDHKPPRNIIQTMYQVWELNLNSHAMELSHEENCIRLPHKGLAMPQLHPPHQPRG